MENFLEQSGRAIARAVKAINPQTHGVLEPFFRGKNLLKKIWLAATLRENIAGFCRKHNLVVEVLPTCDGNIFDKDHKILSAYFDEL